MLTYPEPCDSAPSLPSHAGASGTGFIGAPSTEVVVVFGSQSGESHIVGLPRGPGDRETQILIPAWCSEGLASGPHGSFQTLSGPCKSGVLPISSLQLMAHWSLRPPEWNPARPGLCSALCPVPTLSTTSPLDLRLQLFPLPSWFPFFGDSRPASHDPLWKPQGFLAYCPWRECLASS